jgi:hypothetical protein
MDKDKELTEMMEAIKNLKEKDSSKDLDINSNKVAKEPQEKDTSFYSRIFHHTKVPAEKEECHSDNLQKQLEDYFNSVEFNTKMETVVQRCMLNSVKNEIYMEKIILALLEKYSHLTEEMQQQMNNMLKDEITKVVKICTNNLSNTLKSI